MAENTHLRAVKSFYSQAHGGLVTLEDDVLSIVSQVHDLYGDKVSIQLDPETGWYHFIAHEADNTDRLIFSVDALDPRALERLQKADSHGRGFVDPYDAVEREQDELHRKQEEAYREQIRESGEWLAWALQKEGKAPRLPSKIYVPRGI